LLFAQFRRNGVRCNLHATGIQERDGSGLEKIKYQTDQQLANILFELFGKKPSIKIDKIMINSPKFYFVI
jgi:hypothetical protein